MRRTSCSACGHVDLHQFLDLGHSPIADAYTDHADDAPAMFPLQLAVCTKCHLVQLLEVVDHEVLFGTGYSFYSSASPPLSAYHAAYARDVLARHHALARRGVVEVGCNDGDLLRHFTDYPTLGVDPAAGPARVAAGRGLDIRVAPFGLAEAHTIRDRGGPAGLVFANHVLAHVDDVAGVLAGIAHLLTDNGVAMVEVQYLPDLLVNNAFDLIYHEHRNFFSLSSLEQAARRWGLHIADAELTDRQGGSLRVTLTRNERVNDHVAAIRARERWLTDPCTYDGLQGRVERIRDRLLDLLAEEDAAGRVVAGYGAPAKATTLLHYCDISSMDLTHVVDTTVAKQGRHIPGTGLRIVAPGAAPDPDTWLVLAWNYTAQIMRNHAAFTADGGRWVVPIPAPVIL